ESGARGEQLSVIVREAFVDPKQVASHRFLVAAVDETARTPRLSVPRMKKLVRQEVTASLRRVIVHERILGDSIVRAFVMLDAERAEVVTERQEPVVLAVVPDIAENVPFLD